MKKILLIALLFLTLPQAARAQCDDAYQFAAVEPAIGFMAQPSQPGSLVSQNTLVMNQYIAQELTHTAQMMAVMTYMMVARLDEFDVNLRSWLSDWWFNRYLPALKDMTAQQSTTQVHETMTAGKFQDAQLMNEAQKRKETFALEAQRRYAPSDFSCQIDSFGPAQLRGQKYAADVARGMQKSEIDRRTAATGAANDTAARWKEYTSYFCSRGAPGCRSDGPLAGQQKDISALLWGSKQSIQMSRGDTLRAVKVASRTLSSPFMDNPIPARALETSAGRELLLARRANIARANAVSNVMDKMIAERIGCVRSQKQSCADTSKIRISGGVSREDASTAASYREILEAMAHDRYQSPKYSVALVDGTAQVGREQLIGNALQLQMMNDLYHRSEDMLLLLSAEYARDLDNEGP